MTGRQLSIFWLSCCFRWCVAAHGPRGLRRRPRRGAGASSSALVGFVALPRDEPGVMVRDQHCPLRAGHLGRAHDEAPVGVEALLGVRVLPKTNAPAYTGLVNKSCTAG